MRDSELPVRDSETDVTAMPEGPAGPVPRRLEGSGGSSPRASTTGGLPGEHASATGTEASKPCELAGPALAAGGPAAGDPGTQGPGTADPATEIPPTQGPSAPHPATEIPPTQGAGVRPPGVWDLGAASPIAEGLGAQDPASPPRLAPAVRRAALAATTGVAALAAIGAGTAIVTSMPKGSAPSRGPAPVVGMRTATRTTARQAAPGSVGHPPPTAPHVPAAVPIGHSPGPHARVAPVPTAPAPSTSPTAAAPSVPPTPVAARGTLAARPATVRLHRHAKGGSPAGSFTLTATGGLVPAFTVTVPDGYAGDLVVTPVTGALAAGQSVRVSVTLRTGYHTPLRTHLSVRPGGLIITVVYQPPSG